MLTRYKRAAMEKVVYEIIEDDGSLLRPHPGHRIARHSTLPEIGGIRLEALEGA